MVVQEKTSKKNPPMCHLANKIFQTHSLYGAGAIAVIKDLNPKLVNLDGILLSY